MFRRVFFALVAVAILLMASLVWSGALPAWTWIVMLPVVALGAFDAAQRRHSLLRNYPVVGHLRYALERIRPEIRQYFGESDLDGRPFDRETRSLVYQRAKGDLQSVPFGTKRNLSVAGAEWVPHSMAPRVRLDEEPRVVVGSEDCTRPYAASRLNIAPMSYGALSATAIEALNRGALLDGFAHNTGEGGVSAHHLRPGGDLIWQVGTGYFGCRDASGRFDPSRFADVAAHEQIRMIELKLSQGAKPGYGGILPASKVTQEIAEMRGVLLGVRVVSPPAHGTFQDPLGMLDFVARLRDLAGGKPVGVKLCVGRPRDVFAICKAMVASGVVPDYVVVDGAEGGTGAAPFEFVNHVGSPLEDGLWLVHSALTGLGLRPRVKLFASGRITMGFDVFRALALGADGCFAGRAMMLALGCIQALRCNSNDCPVGVATQNPKLWRALDPVDKGHRVARYHRDTIAAFLDLVAAAGLSNPDDIGPEHVVRRGPDGTVRSLDGYRPPVAPGSLVDGDVPTRWAAEWQRARADAF